MAYEYVSNYKNPVIRHSDYRILIFMPSFCIASSP